MAQLFLAGVCAHFVVSFSLKAGVAKVLGNRLVDKGGKVVQDRASATHIVVGDDSTETDGRAVQVCVCVCL